VVTNQPDVARGTLQRESVDQINRILRDRLHLDDIRVCYHDDADGCACRKPQPGLILEAARDWHAILGKSYVVGDRWRDIEAGRRAGCGTVLIESGYRESMNSAPDYCTESLLDAAHWILTVSDGKGRRPGEVTLEETT
jgi:D-glycero-D-manno-heptose 1,7-bisphosphate phosphatase